MHSAKCRGSFLMADPIRTPISSDIIAFLANESEYCRLFVSRQVDRHETREGVPPQCNCPEWSLAELIHRLTKLRHT